MSVIEVILSATAGSFIGNILGNMMFKWVYGKDDNDD